MAQPWTLTGNAVPATAFLGTTNSQPLSIRTNGAERVTIRQNGNVGVGNASPQVRLHVTGNRVRLESAGKRLDLRADGGAVDIQSETHNLFLHSSGPSGRNNVIINPFGGEGSVGIGTQTPAAKLHVAGNIQANDVIIVSDAGAKTDVEPVAGALEKLQRLRAVAFTRVSEESDPDEAQRSIGVLAQEVEPILPELVHTPTSGGYMGVNYSGLTALLIESVKELVAENRALRQRIEVVERTLGGQGLAQPGAV